MALLKQLGAPAKRGKVVLQEADGTYVQTWKYPKQGLTLVVASEERAGPKNVASILARAPCALKTTRGIGVGSSLGEVRKAYAQEQNREETTTDRFVAGSIYSGVIFELTGRKVTSIFIGAAAE